MAQVITFERYRPVARYDATAWTEVRIEESDTSTLSATTGVGGGRDDRAFPRRRRPVRTPPTVTSQPSSRPTTPTFGTGSSSWTRPVTSRCRPRRCRTSRRKRPRYATTTELARILKIGSPTAAQTVAMERCCSLRPGRSTPRSTCRTTPRFQVGRSRWRNRCAWNAPRAVEAAGDSVRDRRVGFGVRRDAYRSGHVGEARDHVGAAEAERGVSRRCQPRSRTSTCWTRWQLRSTTCSSSAAIPVQVYARHGRLTELLSVRRHVPR